MSPSAYYSDRDRCWFVPVAAEMWKAAEEGELFPVEPARVEIREGQLWITRLDPWPRKAA